MVQEELVDVIEVGLKVVRGYRALFAHRRYVAFDVNVRDV